MLAGYQLAVAEGVHGQCSASCMHVESIGCWLAISRQQRRVCLHTMYLCLFSRHVVWERHTGSIGSEGHQTYCTPVATVSVGFATLRGSFAALAKEQTGLHASCLQVVVHHDFEVKLNIGREVVRLGIPALSYSQLQRCGLAACKGGRPPPSAAPAPGWLKAPPVLPARSTCEC